MAWNDSFYPTTSTCTMQSLVWSSLDGLTTTTAKDPAPSLSWSELRVTLHFRIIFFPKVCISHLFKEKVFESSNNDFTCSLLGPFKLEQLYTLCSSYVYHRYTSVSWSKYVRSEWQTHIHIQKCAWDFQSSQMNAQEHLRMCMLYYQEIYQWETEWDWLILHLHKRIAN